MSTRVFSKEELAQLRGFPEITRDELVRFFTLTLADRAFVDPGRGRSRRDRLGLAIQLFSLLWLGFVADVVTAASPVAVARLARQLPVDLGELEGYGEREQTRTDHLRLVLESGKNWGEARTSRDPGDHCSGHWRAAGSLWVPWPLEPRQGWGHD